MLPLVPDQLPSQLRHSLCFANGQFQAFLLSPEKFQSCAAWVGAVRASTYRQLSPFTPEHVDLDGRDANYWHLLVWDQQGLQLAASLRIALSRWHAAGWDGDCSYLEHCYPGLDAQFNSQAMAYAEVGRTFVTPAYQRTSQVLMVLLQAMASIPLATGHQHVLGLVSYNHFSHGDQLNSQFLSALLAAPFRDPLSIPSPRHPNTLALAPLSAPPVQSLRQLEIQLREHHQEDFQLPVLIKRYQHFANSQVLDLSLAKDFNQITEILMHSDLRQLSARQRRSLVVENLIPVWELDR